MPQQPTAIPLHVYRVIALPLCPIALSGFNLLYGGWNDKRLCWRTPIQRALEVTRTSYSNHSCAILCLSVSALCLGASQTDNRPFRRSGVPPGNRYIHGRFDSATYINEHCFFCRIIFYWRADFRIYLSTKMNAANNRFLGTLHKVSGPQNRDVVPSII